MEPKIELDRLMEAEKTNGTAPFITIDMGKIWEEDAGLSDSTEN